MFGRRFKRSAMAAGVCLAMAMAQPAFAGTDPQDLKALQQQVEQLKQQLHDMGLRLDAAVQDAANANQQVQQVRKSVDQTNATVLSTNAAMNAFATPESADFKFRLAGAVAANFGQSSQMSPSSTFAGGAFMPIFLLRYKDLAEMEAHLEVMNDGDATETSLEYAQIDLFLNDWATLVAGKFLSPVGQFQQAVHPPWVNKLPDRPAGFVESGGGEPLSETGVQIRGAFPLGGMTADYAIFVGNGPQLTEEGLALAGFSRDNNSNKAIGGRFGLRPAPYLNVGISAMHSVVASNAVDLEPGTPGADASHDLYDVDFSYTPPNFDFRGEYIHARLKPVVYDDDSGEPASLVPATTWEMWYLQASHRLTSSNPFLGKLELVARYSQNTVSGGIMDWRMSNEKRSTIGVDYWWSPTIVGKLAYEHKVFDTMPSDNMLRLQMVFGF